MEIHECAGNMRELDSLISQYFDVHNISLSALQKVQPRNAKTTRTLASVKYSQKELFDTVESEFTGSSDKFDVF